MKTRTVRVVIAAASLTLASAVWAQYQPQGDTKAKPNAAQTERERILADTAAGTVSPDERQQIFQTLTRLVEDSTTPGKFNELKDQFAGSPAATGMPANGTPATPPSKVGPPLGGERANPPASGTHAQSANAFDQRAEQFRRDWKEKYHDDFKLQANVDRVFTDAFAQINSSDLGDTARTASAKIGPSTVRDTRLQPNAANAKPDDDTRIDSRAVVLIEASHGAPMATLTLVKGKGGVWKLDTPQGVDENLLRASLARHLDMIEKDKANWPPDPTEAYRLVAHHVFLAIDDAGAGMMQGGSVVQPGALNDVPDPRLRENRR